MIVYLAGIDPVKGVPENRYVLINPGEHLGVDAVPAAWVEGSKDARKGKLIPIHFVNGKTTVEDALGKYLIENGHASKQRWRPPLQLWEVA